MACDRAGALRPAHMENLGELLKAGLSMHLAVLPALSASRRSLLRRGPVVAMARKVTPSASARQASLPHNTRKRTAATRLFFAAQNSAVLLQRSARFRGAPFLRRSSSRLTDPAPAAQSRGARSSASG